MRWLKNQWDNNTNFRHAATVLLCMALAGAGVPANLAAALGGLVEAVKVAAP